MKWATGNVSPYAEKTSNGAGGDWRTFRPLSRGKRSPCRCQGTRQTSSLSSDSEEKTHRSVISLFTFSFTFFSLFL